MLCLLNIRVVRQRDEARLGRSDPGVRLNQYVHGRPIEIELRRIDHFGQRLANAPTAVLFQQTTVPEPFRETLGPPRGCAGFNVVPITEAVPSVGENMKFSGDLRCLVHEIDLR